jgi:hypothetical protein
MPRVVVNSLSGKYQVPTDERTVLIAQLTALGIPQATALFDAGLRHAEYAKTWTDEELRAVQGVTNANVTTIRTITGPYTG